MKFDDSAGSEPYDVQFAKWMTKEKVIITINYCLYLLSL